MAATDPGDIEAFLAVAEARGFRGAAARRGDSPSRLSEAVRRLETRVGVRLLNRTTRSVTPTEAGQRLIARAGPALDELAVAVAEAAGIGARLRLNVPVIAADSFLPGLIARFMVQNPDVAVEVSADNSFVDVLAAGFDAGIRYGERLDQDMIAVPIGPRRQRLVTVASPDYLARAGRPDHPDDLRHHRLLRYRFASGAVSPWEYRRGAETRRIADDAALIAGHHAILVAAAEAGLGLAHQFDSIVAPALEAGRLVEVLADWSDRFDGPFLYFPSRRQMPQGMRRFLEFLRAERATADRTADPAAG
jgi:DNA-binding transcriptional LysR family regulator